MIYTRFYNDDKLPFNRSEALRYFGYGKGKGEPSQEVKNLFDECIKEALSVCSYKICYAEFDLAREDGGKILNLGFTQTDSKSLALNLDGCHKIIAFAATVGVGIDRLIARYSAILPSKAYAFQAIGAERIETLCNAFNEEIKREFQAQGLFTRPRFSCGYGDFSLRHQQDFITALDCNRKIGIALNDGFLMSPSKSVTAIIGISKICRLEKQDKCENCHQQNCAFKK